MAFLYSCLSVLLLFTCILFALGSRSYELKIDRFEEYPNSDDNHFDLSKLIAKKFNRTTMVINGTVTLLKPIPADAIVHAIGNQWMGTAYTPSIILPQKKLCEFIDTENFIVPQLVTHSIGTWNGKCPLDMKEVHILNLVLDEEQFPEQFPGDKWRIDVYLMLKNKNIGGFRGYVTVDRVKELRGKAGAMG